MDQLTGGIDTLIAYGQVLGIALTAIPLLSMGFKFLFKGMRYWGDFIPEFIAVIVGVALILGCFAIRDFIVGSF